MAAIRGARRRHMHLGGTKPTFVYMGKRQAQQIAAYLDSIGAFGTMKPGEERAIDRIEGLKPKLLPMDGVIVL